MPKKLWPKNFKKDHCAVWNHSHTCRCNGSLPGEAVRAGCGLPLWFSIPSHPYS